jgi:hypothetical protein
MNHVFRVAVGALVLAFACHAAAVAAQVASTTQSVYPGVEALLRARTDVLGDAALRQPGGPTYEFFRDLLPPLRYVEPDFKHYPIVLSAPGNTVKARLVSNGSAINALARSRSWISEAGKPVAFYVGDKREPFGNDLAKLDGPRYADGYLPIVQYKYTAADGATYAQEVFASTDEKLAAHGVVLVKLTLLKASGRNWKPPQAEDPDPPTQPVPGVEGAADFAALHKEFDERLEAVIEGPEVFAIKENRVSAPDGKMWAAIHPRWILNAGRGALVMPLKTGESCYLAVFTKPADADFDFTLTPQVYDAQRAQCAKTWNDFLQRGMAIETPEKVVNDASRATLIGNFMLLHGDDMRYSAGNQYAKLYIGEGGDTIRGNTLWGHATESARMIPPQFKYTRAGLEFHQAALKLQMLAHFYRLTRDKEFVRSLEPMWQKEIDVILKGRQTENGMFPREKYAGDVDTRVYSLNSNSNAWRALRDWSVLLAELGDAEQAQKLAATQKEYRKIILDALAKAIRRDVDPPFVPIALSGEESPHIPIWASTMGSYWNLIIEYVIGSGLFTADSQTMTDVLRYIQANGGLCMGILRARTTPGNFWVYGGRLNDLYGMRYALALLQRDEVDRALVSFYGKLAQGMTRDTFIGCEGSSMAPLDQYGRQMALPPNSCANANFLEQLRYILVQDYDLNDDGRAETLRLAYATPRAWLKSGSRIRVDRAPTEFGEVSYVIESALADGRVDAEVTIPERNLAEKVLLRLRLPDERKIESATANGKSVDVAGGANGETIDLSGLKGKVRVSARVGK